jgi:cystathionine beta-lyase
MKRIFPTMKDTDKNKQSAGKNTRLAHAGHNPQDYHGFVNPPVVHASTVLFPDTEVMLSRSAKYVYGTHGTPTSDALADVLSELEGAEGTILVPSGLAAISVPMLAFAKAGDHVLVVDSCYGPTRRFCDTILTDLGVKIEYFDPLIGAGIAEILKPNTSIIMTETPGSNTFEMMDIPAICQAAKAVDAVVMIDNTWATPLYFKALDFGVDISIHALTKYPSGHSDLVLGSASANKRTWEKLRQAQLSMGILGSPDDCYMVFRGLKTMGIRLEHHQKSALEVARWLRERSDVARVLHPALSDDPGHDLWKRDFKGSSGLFAFVLKDCGKDQARKFLDALELFGLGYSWGGFE